MLSFSLVMGISWMLVCYCFGPNMSFGVLRVCWRDKKKKGLPVSAAVGAGLRWRSQDAAKQQHTLPRVLYRVTSTSASIHYHHQHPHHDINVREYTTLLALSLSLPMNYTHFWYLQVDTTHALTGDKIPVR